MKNIFGSFVGNFRKAFLALTVGIVGASAFAQESTANADMKGITDGVKTWLDSVVGSFKAFFSDNFTTIVSILSIAAGITVLWVIFKLFTRGAKKVG